MAQLVKEYACNEGDMGSIPGLGKSPGEGKGYLLQYSGLENSMDCLVRSMGLQRVRGLSDFHFHQEALSASSLSAIRVVFSAYLRLLKFLPAILSPVCASSRQSFHMMYSVYKLNKRGDNIQPWHTPFAIWNQSVVPCPVLTVSS